MNFNHDEPLEQPAESGSDELLSDDNLRLPEHASNLVRIHAIRAWLTRKQQETNIEIGEAVLELQQAQMLEETSTRRRERRRDFAQHRLERALEEAQQRLHAYEEAQSLLEECIDHTTSSERVLVEYYLLLEETIQNNPEVQPAWLQAISDVQHRIERVGAPNEEE